MSTIKKDQTELGGMLGESASLRKVAGRLVVTNRPKVKMRQASEDQLAVQKKFLKASRYAKGQVDKPEKKAMYETGITSKKKSAFLVALSDSLIAPEVNEIKTAAYNGAVGDIIKIDATDDFKVMRVAVVISDSNGAELEQGDAVQDADYLETWRYTALVANPTVLGSSISVTAFDFAGNETLLKKVIVL
ncbi:hypothetical protein BH10BAC4_BH10BAC4_23360 [soil metagenome]